nr:unnamed protein product [Digitaria exilis]
MAPDGHLPEPGKQEVATTAAGAGLNDLVDPQFMCCVCLDLLYKPIVISCGHMSCFWCVHKAMHTYQSQCAVCRQPYKHFPSICQLMHHLLLKLEPADYKRREKEVLEEEKHMQTYSPQIIEFINSKNSGTSSAKGSSRAHHEDLSDVHVGIGCDSCGAYPIRGKRYKCRDCTEVIGFDLCGECYNSSLKLPGRFNQQHTPDHRMELEESTLYQRLQEEMMMIEAAAPPGALLQIVLGNQGIVANAEGPGEAAIEEAVDVPGDMLHIIIDDEEIEDNDEEDQEV